MYARAKEMTYTADRGVFQHGMLFSWASHASNARRGEAQFFDGSPNLYTNKLDVMHFTQCTQTVRPGDTRQRLFTTTLFHPHVDLCSHTLSSQRSMFHRHGT